eukprot:XP_011680654.1 PREDICTED: arachidonate 5-lipoxygenase-like [Strongylocentrotus purpuratus]
MLILRTGVWQIPVCYQRKIVGDYELQEWAAFLASQGNDDTVGEGANGIEAKGGIKGLPNDGHFKTAKEISEVVTSFIFIFSATHASVNFGQYDNYAFPPAYPGWMNGQPPQDKTALTEKDLIAKLPNKKKILKTMSFTKLLSMHDTCALGDFEVQYLFDPVSLGALDKDGLPNDGHFNTAKEISEVVTSFIFIFSATHASVNFGQYDNYAFPPAYPAWMNGQPPQDKLTYMHDTNVLGDFEVQYLFDPVSVEALEEFRKDLKAIEQVITSENEYRKEAYYWLLPSNVPNSIAI